MSRPIKQFLTLPRPKNSQLGPQKDKNNPKVKSKSKVRIEENIEKLGLSWVMLSSAGAKKSFFFIGWGYRAKIFWLLRLRLN